MRNAFAQEITTLAAADERIVLLSGDIGNRLFDDYKARFSGRFFNCGVAEANMIGVAAGMAMAGLRPVVYTIAPFVTYRCMEQIRVDLCYADLPVVVVGVGAGMSYASLGPTHHSCEDIAMLRSLPEMAVVCPGDRWEVIATLRAALNHGKPTYLRIGKKNEPTVHQDVPNLRIGRGHWLRQGETVCLLSTGTLLPETLNAADKLQQQGVSAAVVSYHTVKPLDEELLRDVFDRFELVVTIEEHSLLGGLGSSVAEWAIDQQLKHHPTARLLRCGTGDEFVHEATNLTRVRQQFGLTGDQISQRILETLVREHPESEAA